MTISKFLMALTTMVIIWHGEVVSAEDILQEIPLGAGRGFQQVSIPKDYGKLVSVVESGGVHYLYFQDEEGPFRIVFVGIKGTASRSKVDLEALPHSVYKISRSEE